jgi:integrase
VRDLELPGVGWEWINVQRAGAEVNRQWTDDGARRSEGPLKHRAKDSLRRVPVPPGLTAMLWRHVSAYGTNPQGVLFPGERGGALADVTYARLWSRARHAALTDEQYASPLARRPYDLRHAAVPTWLNEGVPHTQVAEWAGHNVEVLLRVYAKCIDDGEVAALRRIDAALSV